MEGAAKISPPPERAQSLVALNEGQPSPFSQQWVTISKQEHSEKNSPLKSKKDGKADLPSRCKRGQQPGSQGHGRTQRPNLAVVHDESDLAQAEKSCPTCGLPHLPAPALDEHSDVIEVEVKVKAHVRRIRRRAYTRNPGCTCEDTPAILTAPPPLRVIPRSGFGVSFWVEVILGKYR